MATSVTYLKRNRSHFPPLPESITKYFKDIVDACRREDPSTRLAAREILGMVPSSDKNSRDHQNHHHQQQEHGQPRLLPQQDSTADVESLAAASAAERYHAATAKKGPCPFTSVTHVTKETLTSTKRITTTACITVTINTCWWSWARLGVVSCRGVVILA